MSDFISHESVDLQAFSFVSDPFLNAFRDFNMEDRERVIACFLNFADDYNLVFVAGNGIAANNTVLILQIIVRKGRDFKLAVIIAVLVGFKQKDIALDKGKRHGVEVFVVF